MATKKNFRLWYVSSIDELGGWRLEPATVAARERCQNLSGWRCVGGTSPYIFLDGIDRRLIPVLEELCVAGISRAELEIEPPDACVLSATEWREFHVAAALPLVPFFRSKRGLVYN